MNWSSTIATDIDYATPLKRCVLETQVSRVGNVVPVSRVAKWIGDHTAAGDVVVKTVVDMAM